VSAQTGLLMNFGAATFKEGVRRVANSRSSSRLGGFGWDSFRAVEPERGFDDCLTQSREAAEGPTRRARSSDRHPTAALAWAFLTPRFAKNGDRHDFLPGPRLKRSISPENGDCPHFTRGLSHPKHRRGPYRRISGGWPRLWIARLPV